MPQRPFPILWIALWLAGPATSAPAQGPAASVDVPLEAAPASAAQPEPHWNRRLAALVLESRASVERERDSVAKQLAGLGALAAPALLDGSLDGRLQLDDGELFALADGERAALREAAQRLGEGKLLELAHETAAQGQGQLDDRSALRALEALALCGRARDLPLALQISLGVDLAGPAVGRTQRGLERAVREICARDGSGLRDLDALLEDSPETLSVALLRGVADCGRAQALEALLRVLPRRPELGVSILGELPRAARGADLPLDEWALAPVRASLAAESISERRAAVRACGGLEDFASAPVLIELLGADEPGLRDDAAAALSELAAMSYGTDPAPWRAWLLREQAWYTSEVPRLVGELSLPVLGRVLAAQRQLAEHRYRRHDLARIVARGLQDPQVPMRLATIACLRALGSRSGLPALVLALDDRDLAVAQEAWSCLVALTGEELGAERSVWEQWLTQHS